MGKANHDLLPTSKREMTSNAEVQYSAVYWLRLEVMVESFFSDSLKTLDVPITLLQGTPSSWPERIYIRPDQAMQYQAPPY